MAKCSKGTNCGMKVGGLKDPNCRPHYVMMGSFLAPSLRPSVCYPDLEKYITKQ